MMKEQTNANQRERGFTLLEIALSLLVIAFGLMGVFALFPAGLTASRQAIDDGQISVFAASLLSDLRAHMADAYSDDGSGYVYAYNGQDVEIDKKSLVHDAGGNPLCTCLLLVQPVEVGELAEIQLTCWPGQQTDRNLEFYTRVANRH